MMEIVSSHKQVFLLHWHNFCRS